MYTRSYYREENEVVNPPENYDGVTFSSQNEQSFDNFQPQAAHTQNKNPWESEKVEPTLGKPQSGTVAPLGIPFLSGIFGKGILPFGGLKFPKIGTEEILILGAAAFLFFSREGDRECALLLLFLLLIG